jgi:hypothetical protein
MSDVIDIETHSVSEKRRQLKEPKIHPTKFMPGPYRSARFEALLPVGAKYEDCLKPEFWSQVAHVLEPPKGTTDRAWEGSIIEVRTEDHKFYAELYVRGVKKQELVVAPLRDPVYFWEEKKPQTSDSQQPDRWLTKWNVGTRSFDIIRQSDKEVVSTGFKVKEDAVAWIKENEA